MGENKSLLNQFFQGIFWESVKFFLQITLRFGVVAVLARLVSPEAFGVMTAALIVIDFPQVAIQSSLNAYLIRHETLQDKHIETCFTIGLSFNILFVVVIFLVRSYLEVIFALSDFSRIIGLLSLLCLLRALNTVPQALLRRNLDFRVAALIDLVSYGLGYGLVGILLGWYGYGVDALIGATVGQAVVAFLILHIVQPYSKKLVFDKVYLQDLKEYALGYGFGNIANYVAQQGDYFIVGRMLGAQQLGYYSRAYYLMTQPAQMFSKIVSQVFFSAMAKIQDNKEQFLLAFRRGIVLTTLISAPATVLLTVLAPEIVALLLGPGWEPVVLPLRILSLCVYFRIGYGLNMSLLTLRGHVKDLARLQVIYALSILVGVSFGTQWGIIGSSISVLFILIMYFFLVANLCVQKLGVSWREFALYHLPAFRLLVVLMPCGWFVALFLRHSWQSDVLIVILTMGLTSVLVLPLIYFVPRFFLGDDGRWWISILTKRLSIFQNR